MPQRHIASGGSSVIGSPENTTVPLSALKAPAITLNNVVLPDPFWPITAKISPSVTLNETLSTATRPRNRLLTSLSESSALIDHAPRRQAGGPATAKCPPATRQPPAT